MQNQRSNHALERIGIPCIDPLEFGAFKKHDKGRQAVEQHIVTAYRKNFGATLCKLMPTLVSANRPGKSTHISFGLCAAGEQRLFLESYLQEPVEQALSNVTELDIQRESIIEIGNMAFSDVSRVRDDLASIAFYCHQMGYQYVVCTATRMLRFIFARTGLKPVYLIKADQSSAPKDGSRWGAYYESAPQVIGGNVLLGIRQLLKTERARRAQCETG